VYSGLDRVFHQPIRPTSRHTTQTRMIDHVAYISECFRVLVLQLTHRNTSYVLGYKRSLTEPRGAAHLEMCPNGAEPDTELGKTIAS